MTRGGRDPALRQALHDRLREGGLSPDSAPDSAGWQQALLVMESVLHDQNLFKPASDRARLPYVDGPRTLLPASFSGLGGLFSTLSHELRTPMTVVLGAFELLRERELAVDEQTIVANGHVAGIQMLRVVDNILQFATLHYGIQALAPQAFDLTESLTRLVARFQRQAQAQGLTLGLKLDPELPKCVFADPARVEQVLEELLENALKFTPAGNVEVSAKLCEQLGKISRVEFVVADSGIGIADAAREHVFQPFAQVDSSSTRRFGGTGLGLAMAKRLVECMAGEVGFTSELGRGSRFWFSIPFPLAEGSEMVSFRRGAPLATEHTVGLRLAGEKRACKILVADDNPFNRELVLRALKGYADVVVVGTGRDAVDAVERGNFGLVLMDCQMPDMDGLEATRLIRAAGRERDYVPIVALTANAMPGDRERCEAAGMDDYLAKPFELDVLRAVVNRYVGPSQITQSAETLPPLAERSPSQAVLALGDRFGASIQPKIVELESDGIRAVHQDPVVVDLSRLQQLSEEAGSIDLVVELSEIFLSDTEHRIAMMSKALAHGDFHTLYRSGHTIKGAAGSFGAPEMAALAEKMEVSAKAHDELAAAKLLVELTSAFARVRNYLTAAVLPGRTDTMPSPRANSLKPRAEV